MNIYSLFKVTCSVSSCTMLLLNKAPPLTPPTLIEFLSSLLVNDSSSLSPN